MAAAYLLGAVGTLDDSEGRISAIEGLFSPARSDWESMLSSTASHPADHALVKMAAHLVDHSYPAHVDDIFSPLGDEYQAVAYQALLIVYPSFSKTWEQRFDFTDSH